MCVWLGGWAGVCVCVGGGGVDGQGDTLMKFFFFKHKYLIMIYSKSCNKSTYFVQ